MIQSPRRNRMQEANSKGPGPCVDKYGKRKRAQMKAKRQVAKASRRANR